MNTYLYRASNLKSTITFLASGLSFIAEVDFWRPLKTIVSCDLFIIIRECGSTLCRVGTHSSTHQYKLLVNFSTNPTSEGSQ